MSNAYIFVGADITGINDSIIAPAHGQLPGVFAHAMAFDNLVKYGTGYFSEAPMLAAMLIELMMIFFVISTTRIVSIGYGKRRKSLRRSKKAALRWDRRRPLLWAWLMIGIIGLVPLAATIILYLGYKLPPANWVGVLSLMIFSALFVFQDTARFISMRLTKKFWLS